MILKTSGNHIFMYGTIYPGDGSYFLDAFSRLDGIYPQLEIHIHCNGGSVFDGNLIYNTILSAKSECIGVIDGVAASMAAILLIAFKKVLMAENGFLMLHAPSGGTYGDAKQHESNAALLRSIEKNFIKKLVARTGKSEKDVVKWMDGDNWFDAEQALEAGLIDEIIEPVTDIKVDDPTNNLQDTFNAFAALYVAKGDTDNNNLKINSMKTDLIHKFGLSGVNAQSSDTAILDAVQAHFDNKLAEANAKLTAAEQKLTALETAANESRDANIKAMLDKAEGAKKITAAQRATYESIGKTSGVDALQTVLDGLTAHAPLTERLKTGTGGSATASAGRDGWDWDKYQKEDPRALEAMAVNDPEAFNALYEAKYKKPFNS
jgi:ATP-dependent Clp endopeptidase proteolytic subunit ClpP